MKLLLVSLNYAPELTGIGKYNGEMCEKFAKSGITTSAIVAPPYYPDWKIKSGFSGKKYLRENIEGVDVIRCPIYVPEKVTTVKRILHLSSFAISSGIALLSKVFSRPDVILLVQPTLFCAPFTLLFAKLFGIKTVMHIQDYEVDALFGLGMLKQGFCAKVAKHLERFLMRRFDIVSSISFSMLENAESKGVDRDKLVFFPNWSDTDFITPDVSGSQLKRQWGLESDDRVILYSGNIGYKQGLDIIVDVAKAFTSFFKVKFVFVGEGAYLYTLKEKVKESGLSNIMFKPLQPWERVPEMLALADIHLVVQRKGAADAVLPSKLTNILAAGGHAIVTAELNTELGKIATKYEGIYSRVEPENTEALSDKISNLLTKKLSAHNDIARRCAIENINKDKVINRFLIEVQRIFYTERRETASVVNVENKKV